MPWLWDDDKEYRDYVRPIELDRNAPVRQTHHQTSFEAQKKLLEAAADLSAASRQLGELGFDKDSRLKNREVLEDAKTLTWGLVRGGEELLLYHRRLAKSDWAYDFLHEHELENHWDRYAVNDRIFREVGKLVEAADKLWMGFQTLQQEDDRFLSDELGDLPEKLQADFISSRNLFSVGFDEMAIFAASRGLEGVLRDIARRRNLMLLGKNNKYAGDADLHDLIDTFAQLKFANSRPVLDKEVLALLNFGRTVRNASAHPGNRPRQTARQLAQVIASEAYHVWKKCKGTRFRTTEKS